MSKSLITFSLVLLSSLALSQEKRDFNFYNSKTYALYTSQSWAELVSLAKESIELGHDFYYMRMRLGIAYFEQKKYTQAKKQFEIALTFNESSNDAKYYLYHCYLYLGRIKDAAKYAKHVEEKPKFLSALYFEPGLKLSNNAASPRDVKYIFLGLIHDIGKRASLFHGYQRLKADFATTTNPVPGSGPGGSQPSENLYSVNQNEYYAAFDFLAAKGFHIVPAFHMQGVKSESYTGTNTSVSLRLTKWFDFVKLYAGYYHLQINENKQQQIEGGMVIYPLGNTNFYVQGQVINHVENSNHSIILHGSIGTKIFSKTWLDISFSQGDMLNYAESNGYLLYNQLDVIKSKFGVGINQYLGNHLVSFRYINENKEEFLTQEPFLHHDFILGFNLIF